MTVLEFSKLINRHWIEEWKHKPQFAAISSETKFITGDTKMDAHLHYLETQCGVVLNLTADYKKIVSYQVVDQHLYLMFVLKWTG